MRTSISLLFRTRKPKNYKSGPFPIYLRITVDGQRCEIAMSRQCEPSKWNSQAGRAKGTKADIKQLNSFLDDTQNKILDLHRQMTESGEEVTIETLKNIFTGKSGKSEHYLMYSQIITKRCEYLWDKSLRKVLFNDTKLL